MKINFNFLKISCIIIISLFIATNISFADPQVAITGTVNPTKANFPLSISVSPSQSEYNQNSVITYTINYGNTFGGSSLSNFTIVANWSKDNPVNSSVDILDYIDNSATKAYANTPAVVDLNNKQITWTISNFPANTTNQSVSFQLKTNSNYKDPSLVQFSVSAHIINSYITTPDVSITQNYSYLSALPTPTPVLLTPTPSPVQNDLIFNQINFVSVTDNSAAIDVITSKPTIITLYQGKSPNELTKTIETSQSSLLNHLVLNNLQSQTKYYVQLVAQSDSEEITSEIFTFQTAQNSTPPSVQKYSLLGISNNIITSSNSLVKSNSPLIEATQNIPLAVRFNISSTSNIKSVLLKVINSNILGASTQKSNLYDAAEVENMIEVEPGVFTAKIKSSLPAGSYFLNVTIIDKSGNIQEISLGKLIILSPLKVIDKNTLSPIEGARIFLYKYSTTFKKYLSLTSYSDLISINNPVETKRDGTTSLVLPPGLYKASISDLNYKDQIVYFKISTGKGDGYPTVLMQNQPVSVQTSALYYGGIIRDFIISQKDLFIQAANSYRIFNLVTNFSLSLFILLAILSLLIRAKIHFPYIHYFIFYHFSNSLRIKQHAISAGKIIDENGNPIKQAEIYLLNARRTVMRHTRSNDKGLYYVANFVAPITLVVKEGYEPFNEPGIFSSITLKKSNKPLVSNIGKHLLEITLGGSFEFLLIYSISLEIAFVAIFGFLQTFPYLIISLLTVLLWISYVRYWHEV